MESQVKIVYLTQREKPARLREERCGCVVREKKTGLYLTVQEQSSGYIGFPKGHRERNRKTKQFCETRPKCAERELHQETGVRLKIGDATRTLKWKHSYFYVLEVDGFPVTTLKRPREIREIKWRSLEELKALKRDEISNLTRYMITKL